MKKRVGLVAAVVAVLVMGSVLVSGKVVALTSWQTFGSGWAHTRGTWGAAPGINISSVTLANPEQVRFTIKNHAVGSRDVTVTWSLDCWTTDEFGVDDVLTSKIGNYDTLIAGGVTHTKAITFNKAAKWCDLSVWADYSLDNFGAPGKMTVTVQAKY